jgi:hypothetical protein
MSIIFDVRYKQWMYAGLYVPPGEDFRWRRCVDKFGACKTRQLDAQARPTTAPDTLSASIGERTRLDGKNTHAQPIVTKRRIQNSRSSTAGNGSVGGERKAAIRMRKLACTACQFCSVRLKKKGLRTTPSWRCTGPIRKSTVDTQPATAPRKAGFHLAHVQLAGIQRRAAGSCNHFLVFFAPVVLVFGLLPAAGGFSVALDGADAFSFAWDAKATRWSSRGDESACVDASVWSERCIELLGTSILPGTMSEPCWTTGGGE